MSASPAAGDTSSVPAPDLQGQAAVLGAFAERQRAYNDFVRSLGEYQIDAAQADLGEAQAAGELEKVAVVQTVLAQLQNDLARLNRETAAAEAKIHEVNVTARYAAFLLDGRPVGGSFGQVRDAYKYFERRFLVEADQKLLDSLALPAGTVIMGEDFIDNDDPSRPCEDPDFYALRNALTLLAWAFDKRYIARDGGPAQDAFVRLFNASGSVARSTTARLNGYIDQIRAGTYAAWSPVQILGIEASDAQKAIVSNSGPNKSD